MRRCRQPPPRFSVAERRWCWRTATGARRLPAEAVAQAGVGGRPPKAFGAAAQLMIARRHQALYTSMLRIRECYRWSKLALCLVSFTAGTGTVLSQGTINFPPVGEMAQPSNHALIRSIGPTTLRAAMSDPDGSIASIRFYSGTNLLGNGIPSGLSEFVMTWTPGRTGNFGLSAEAVDNSGATGKTATVWISVATNPPAFAVIELETSQTNVFFNPLAINNLGVVVGSITNAAALAQLAFRNLRRFRQTGCRQSRERPGNDCRRVYPSPRPGRRYLSTLLLHSRPRCQATARTDGWNGK